MYAGTWKFAAKYYLIDGVGFFSEVSTPQEVYSYYDSPLSGSQLSIQASGSNFLNFKVTLPATANSGSYRFSANVVTTKANIS